MLLRDATCRFADKCITGNDLERCSVGVRNFHYSLNDDIHYRTEIIPAEGDLLLGLNDLSHSAGVFQEGRIGRGSYTVRLLASHQNSVNAAVDQSQCRENRKAQ